jgi:hypothetical protein
MKLFFLMVLVQAAFAFGPEAELRDSAGKTIIRYVVEAPREPAKQLGLFLCFAEHERPTGDEILPVREALRRLGMSDQFVLIAGHSQGLKMSMADHEPIRKLTEWALKNYPINPRRIYMYGKGEGGKVSGEFAGTHPRLIAAAVTYSWGWWVMPPEIEAPIDFERTAPEFYMVLGMRDLATHIATVRDTYGRVREKGFHVIYREFDDLGARTYHPASNDDAIAWATRMRNKTAAISQAEAEVLRRYSGGNAPKPAASGYFEDLAMVGGFPAAGVVRQLLRSGDAATRAAAAETCRHAIFSEETTAALGKSAVDPDVRVRRAALGALAMYANWRSAAAQKILIEMATQPEKAVAPEDRISAVDGLGAAVRFQVKGVRQDPPVFRALVGLLTDKDEEVRTMASNILAPIRDPEFRGDAGRPEKKAPEGGWAAWLDGITAKEAGYQKDYAVCSEAGRTEAVELFCKGGETGRVNPKEGFELTRRSAEMGYVPAEAALGLMWANGKGVVQNYIEAGKWWSKAGEGGHALAAANAARAPKVAVPGAIQ